MKDFFERLIDLNQYKILRKIISLLDLKVDFIYRFYLNFGFNPGAGGGITFDAKALLSQIKENHANSENFHYSLNL